MTATRRRLGRHATITVLAVIALACSSLLVAPAASAGAIAEYIHRHDHPLGSQIVKHERSQQQQAAADDDASEPDGLEGIDVSGWQGEVDWQHWWEQGKRFAYVKATEGTGYTNPYFTQQYDGSYDVGMIRGAYHFALPDRSSGATQATYFVERGGGWSSDGKTLPGALDLEYNPYGATCYGKSQRAMRSWIADFHDTYHEITGRYPVIYTSASWWNTCVGDGHGFEDTVPMWVARYSDEVGEMPAGWDFHTFWQYTNHPIDQNVFNGSRAQLRALASGD